MREITEIIKNIRKTQKDIELIVNKYSGQSYRTQSEVEHGALIQRTICDQPRETIGEAIEDMDKEINLKHNEIYFFI